MAYAYHRYRTRALSNPESLVWRSEERVRLRTAVHQLVVGQFDTLARTFGTRGLAPIMILYDDGGVYPNGMLSHRMSCRVTKRSARTVPRRRTNIPARWQ